MSVKSFRIEGTSLVMSLRGGGEIVCEASIVSRIDPDEVPYPEEVLPVSAARAEDRFDAHDFGPLTATPELVPNPYFDSMIETAAARHGVDASLVRAVIQVESNYQQRARSPKGAKGLMQL